MAPAFFHERSLGNHTRIHSVLLLNKTATDDGKWTLVGSTHPLSIHISGIGTATVRLHGSNAPSQPDDSDSEVQLGSDIMSDGIFSTETPIKWIKVSVPSYNSGNISAYLEGFF